MILLGDTLNDLSMASEILKSRDFELSFGFFKDDNIKNNPNLLDLYLDKYDVVIRGDGSFLFIEIIFAIITG